MSESFDPQKQDAGQTDGASTEDSSSPVTTPEPTVLPEPTEGGGEGAASEPAETA